jgi:hypothetical protein
MRVLLDLIIGGGALTLGAAMLLRQLNIGSDTKELLLPIVVLISGLILSFIALRSRIGLNRQK